MTLTERIARRWARHSTLARLGWAMFLVSFALSHAWMLAGHLAPALDDMGRLGVAHNLSRWALHLEVFMLTFIFWAGAGDAMARLVWGCLAVLQGITVFQFLLCNMSVHPLTRASLAAADGGSMAQDACGVMFGWITPKLYFLIVFLIAGWIAYRIFVPRDKDGRSDPPCNPNARRGDGNQ